MDLSIVIGLTLAWVGAWFWYCASTHELTRFSTLLGLWGLLAIEPVVQIVRLAWLLVTGQL